MMHSYPLLKLLADGRYHSGDTLASALAISRTAVWKQVKKLASIGIEVHAVKGKGYRLAQKIDLLNHEQIRAGLSDQVNTHCNLIEIMPEIDSTNRYLMRMAGQGCPSGAVCLAERQTEGRGRHGKTWVSPFAANVYLSLLWRFSCSPMELGSLSLAVGTAAARAISSLGVDGIGLKWPNDLIWNGRKLGGVLLELTGETSGPCVVVIGIGINVHMPEKEGEKIEQPWVDISTLAGGVSISRNRLVSTLLDELVSTLKTFPDTGCKKLLDEWRKWDVVTGKTVKLTLPDRQYSGMVVGVDDDGMLLLELDGRVEKFSSGEVSLRVAS